MRSVELPAPVPMQRVAILAPAVGVHDVLVEVARAGTADLDAASTSAAGPADQATNLRSLAEIQGEGVTSGQATGWVGWVPAADVPALGAGLGKTGGALVSLPCPPTMTPPTLLEPSVLGGALSPLVSTYGTVPYPDLDPTVVAGLAYVAMFGVMFADIGHGLCLVLLGLVLRRGRVRRLASMQRLWPFLTGAGIAGAGFGAAYGEFFGPTHLTPVLWLNPLDSAGHLLLAAVAVGAGLLASAFVLGAVNRFREGGWRQALYATSGVAGIGLFLGLGLAAAGWYWSLLPVVITGGVLTTAALGMAYVGLLALNGGGLGGALQAVIELFDTVVRLGSNLISFTRLAAFGLMHAALGLVVWEATQSLWGRGGGCFALAVVLFVIGNGLAFALEALIAGVQALRLEYYELFSRVFATEGRPFRPWRPDLVNEEGS